MSRAEGLASKSVVYCVVCFFVFLLFYCSKYLLEIREGRKEIGGKGREGREAGNKDKVVKYGKDITNLQTCVVLLKCLVRLKFSTHTFQLRREKL